MLNILHVLTEQEGERIYKVNIINFLIENKVNFQYFYEINGKNINGIKTYLDAFKNTEEKIRTINIIVIEKFDKNLGDKNQQALEVRCRRLNNFIDIQNLIETFNSK